MMTSYGKLWKQGIGVVAVIGTAASVLTFPFAGVAWMLAIGIVMGAAVGVAVQIEERPGRWRRAAKISGCSGVAVPALAGLTTLLGPAAYAVAIAAVGTSPPVVTWLRACASRSDDVRATDPSKDLRVPTYRSRDAHLDVPPDVALLPTSPELLDDEALCLAWRRSDLLLQHSLPFETRVLVVHLRQRYLDEMERINPLELSAWLASENLPAINPCSYFTSEEEPPPTGTGQASP